jgi:hypothetical protein
VFGEEEAAGAQWEEQGTERLQKDGPRGLLVSLKERCRRRCAPRWGGNPGLPATPEWREPATYFWESHPFACNPATAPAR